MDGPKCIGSVRVKCLQTIEDLKNSCDKLGIIFNDYTKNMWKVDFILDDENQKFFFVKWQGRGSKYNSWEPACRLSDAKDLVTYYINLNNPAAKLSEEMVLYFVKELTTRKPYDILTLTQLYALISKCDDDEKISKLTFSYLKTEIISCLDNPVDKNRLLKQKDDLLYLMKFFEKRKNVLSLLKEWEAEINAHSLSYVKVENNVDLEKPPTQFSFVSNYVSDDVDLTEYPVVFCACSDCYENCSDCCASNLDGKFAYNKDGCLQLPVGNPIYECNELCKCDKNCVNRVVQHGPKVRVAIFRTKNGCGWGLKTLETLRRGQFVLEYLGEVITSEQADVRGEVYDHLGKTYLFDMGWEEDCFYTIDAMQFGNASHFINHSCDPNLTTYSVYVNQQNPKLPRIALFAKKKINEGEELTFDYKINVRKNNVDSSKNGPISCKCQAKNCRKYVY